MSSDNHTIKIKNKLIDKINSLTSSATPRQLTYMTKSLERLNNALDQQGLTEGTGGDEIIEFHQSTLPPYNKNLTRAGIGASGGPEEFGLFAQHSWYYARYVNYGESLQGLDARTNQHCHVHSGSRGGGIWNYWSSAQRGYCAHWGGNCYWHFPTSSSPGGDACYSNGGMPAGPLGNSTFLLSGSEIGMPMTWPTNDGNTQTTGRAPRHEARNENAICGNYELSDKQSYLTYDKQTIYLKSKRVMPGAGPSANFSQKASNCGDINSFGTLSHNADRGELVVMNLDDSVKDGYGEAGTMFECRLWKQCPTININTDLSTYLDNANMISWHVRFDSRRNANITPTWLYTEGADTTAWDGLANRNEAQAMREGQSWGTYVFDPTDQSGGPESKPHCVTDNKLCLTNNGDLYYSIWSRYAHAIFKSTRYRNPSTGLEDDTYYETIFKPSWNHEAYLKNISGYDEHRRNNITGYEPLGHRPRLLHYNNLDDTYGREQGTSSYGTAGSSWAGAHFAIMSRHKKNVVFTSPYYRYQVGNSAYLVDKRFNRWSIFNYIVDTSHGVSWAPFGREGFVCNFARNNSGINTDTRLYAYRQNTNSGEWTRTDISRNLAFHNHVSANYFAIIPHDA